MLTEQRRNVRDALEKSIALWKATGSICVIITVIILVYDIDKCIFLCSMSYVVTVTRDLMISGMSVVL